MTIQILMPALSPTMTEGNLAKWLKKEGDTVKSGDVLAEIETDKATMEVEAVDEGRIGKILVAAGSQGVAVNTPIAILLEEGEDESALANAGASAPAPAPAAAPAPQAAPAAQPAAAAAPSVSAAAPAPAASGDRVFASPLARRIAGQAGIDLKAVKGSGPNGRIVKADVDAAIAGGGAKAAPAPQAAAPAAKPAAQPAAAPAPAARPAPAGVDAKDLSDKLGMVYTAVPNTGMRKTIARRLGEAKQTVPHFYLTIDCQIDTLMKVRAELNGRSDSYKLSVNDFVIRASALALKKVPAANAAWTDEAILMYEHADISVAVATPSGLITPIIKKAEGKGLAQISNEMKDLAKRARDGKLKPEEFQGGTFSVSNLGMFGIREFAAIINPPQGCILAVGAAEQRPVVKDGALAVATMMTCTLSVDHRVVDGAVGAEFLAAFKKLIEDPLSMLL
ncbi:pyruvate dehydrogenase complex dihydrolipoamide acetyltransferase [Azospirillum thermophilum]|uniref:Acetyltransferase component of pyruvate dehydrogenase complex n=1 Tax=Azospirillum thermophilum TaxID=2202148 RepID=A0A2S2CRK6_9PROT|nr:pyruvate dehydrogenase complex dihydrolipoamide acetyltransferase [Azospirillum thermophilum]AWK87055.1 pyruvate dehydrogenase complex dihydrolipoamide acetyltransferase [Azospirillum thermophilum]